MYANFRINPTMFASGATGSTINIPVVIDFQTIDNGELIETDFVNYEVNQSINPILDYEKVRFIPVYNNGTPKQVDNITYNLSFLVNGILKNPTYYSDLGLDDSDVKYERNYFTEGYLYLGFYDSDNALTQNLVNEIEIYNVLTDNDFVGGVHVGVNQPNPASQIPVKFVVSNPLTVNGTYEGYHLYNYKDEMVFGAPKYLYMKANYFNAKNGKTINLMNNPNIYGIDTLVNKLYTRYKLYRDVTSFYYEIDTTYSSNVTYNSTNITVNLYQIQVL